MSTNLLDALRLLREPVPEEKKRLLRERWDSLDPRWRTPAQGFGQKATGCGATIGVHPRCDFDCTGCYLGSGANQIRPLARDATFRQIDRLRAHLGPKGNVQITDGEVTLLPADDLIAILLYARQAGLLPMVMTHGDAFRRTPGLLERLMIEGALTEVSIHIDSTQRGRMGYRSARDEISLFPLRDEFADMIRTARKTIGRPLRAAMTLTIERSNLDAVPGVVEWGLRNRDAFGMLSFQPLAQVGRTQEDLEGVSVDELWDRIMPILRSHGLDCAAPARFLFGHPSCSRIEPMGVYQRLGEPPRLFPIVRDDHPEDSAVMARFLMLGMGGINYRDDTRLERVCRTLGVIRADPAWFLGPVVGWVRARLEALGTSLSGLAIDALRGRVRLDGFSVVSHHFMSPAEMVTSEGRERLDACVFRLPIDGEMVPMCRVNAGGVREAFYANIPPRRAEDRDVKRDHVPCTDLNSDIVVSDRGEHRSCGQ